MRSRVLKKGIVFFMTFAMVFTMMPQTFGMSYAEETQSRQESESKNAETADAGAVLSVSWQPEELAEDADDENSAEREVSLKASYSPEGSGITSAEVKIRLEENEAALLKQFRDKDSKLDENIALTPDEGGDINVKKGENGELYLVFSLDSKKPSLKAGLDFGVFENADIAAGTYDIDVAADDITAEAVYADGGRKALDTSDIDVTTEKFTVTVEKKDAPDILGRNEMLQRSAISRDIVGNDDLGDQLSVEINGYTEQQTQNIFWIDNNNEANARPEKSDVIPVLSFSLAGDGKYTELTEENMDTLGLSDLPEIKIEETGIGKWAVTVPKLPNCVIHTDGYGVETEYDAIQWKITPKQQIDTANGQKYQLTEVTDENMETYGVKETGWYYVLTRDLIYHIEFRKGGQELDQDAAMETILANFKFYISGEKEPLTIQQVIERYGKENVDATISKDPGKGAFEVHNVPKFNLDGTRITYSIKTINDSNRVDPTVDGKPVLADGDYYTILFDNTAVPGYTAVTDAVYSGGTGYLTLTGETDYSAEKVWLDEGDRETAEKRPAGEFQLWRYRQGESYTTAAPVRDENGNIITIELDRDPSDEASADPEFSAQKIDIYSLSKYDTEGYRYYYVVKEYLESTTDNEESEANNYEQVFGGVNGFYDRVENVQNSADDPDAVSRDQGNTYLYNGGILLNRITDTTIVSGTKIWNAAAFQAAFDGVKVTLRLYSRPAGSDEEWEKTDTIHKMENFSAEIAIDDITATMPKYDEYGQELEYIWREDGVYQNDGNEENNLLTPDAEDPDIAHFELQQDGRTVEYTSESTIDQENGETIITNSIANTVIYNVEKKWYNAEGELLDDNDPVLGGAEVKFALYRVINGEDISADKKVAEFTMDGKVDEEATEVQINNAGSVIRMKETAPWIAEVDPLTEFDENGNQYEYVLMETDGLKNYIPEYDVKKDKDGNYYATVINKPGPGPRIMVRKNWNDNSDIAHREQVEIKAYVNSDGIQTEVGSIVLGAQNKDGTTGAWYDWMGLKLPEGTTVEDVYILETKVGNVEIPIGKDDYRSWTDSKPTLDNGNNTDYSTYQYQATHHKYELSYSKEEVEGVDFYTVENRRLGNVNLTVTKTWTDGDGELRDKIKEELNELNEDGTNIQLGMKLRFHDAAKANGNYERDYTIENKEGKGYVSIGRKADDVPIYDKDNNPVSYIQQVDFTQDQLIYFYNLPKYDANSDIVRYDVHEVWLVNGKEATKSDLAVYEDLYALIEDYDTRYTEGGYKIVENHGVPDEQSIGVENYLTGQKDIQWQKAWRDSYNYNNSLRPDIYLDIYSKSHYEENGEVKEKTQVYQKDYKWTFEESDDPQYNKQNYWFAEIENVPKYDDLGYEIMYYAVEKTTVDKDSFDYMDVFYLEPGSNITDPDIDTDDYIGTEYEISNEDHKQYVTDINSAGDPAAEGQSAHYALIEDGTFINHLQEDVTIRAEKIWSSMPEGYDMKNLPTATFTLYRHVDGAVLEEGKHGDPVATITIKGSDWAEILRNGSYNFAFEYMGKNTYEKVEGEVFIKPVDQSAEKLQKYDDDGRLWVYSVIETGLNANGNAGTGYSNNMMQDVFDTPVSDVNTAIENTYTSKEGSLAVKKFLYLPMTMTEGNDGEWTPEAYPAVTFELTRSYIGNDGNTVQDNVFRQTAVWSSEAVEDAYNQKYGSPVSNLISFFTGDPAKAGKDDVDKNGNLNKPLEKTLSFENLDIYAPNGSKYIYNVREVKDELSGYDTWVSAADVAAKDVDTMVEKKDPVTEPDGLSVGDIKLTENDTDNVKATYANRPDTKRDTVTISGEKIWQDFDNLFNNRPKEIKVELYRQADAQQGQSNSISAAKVSEGLYEITWTGNGDNDKSNGDGKTAGNGTWAYSIKGKTDTGELERYAPNGMPWKYYVKEVALIYETSSGEQPVSVEDSIYDVLPDDAETDPAGAGPGADSNIELSDLTNTLETDAPFTKIWVDSKGRVIDEDLLGVELSVDFRLQVAEVADGEVSGTWSDAEDYFKNSLDTEGTTEDESDSVYNQMFGDYSFTQTVTGAIDDDKTWGKNVKHIFDDLPKYIKKKDSSDPEFMTELTYRVVESEISYDADKDPETPDVFQTAEVISIDNGTYMYKFTGGIFSPAYPEGNGWSAEGSYGDTASDFGNMLKTTDLTATKVWQEDAGNAYGTRGHTGHPMNDWEVSFVVQRSKDNGNTWENVLVHDGNADPHPLVVTIYGENSEAKKSIEIDGLPKYDLTDGDNEYRYRVREVDTNGSTIIDAADPEDNRYNTSYTVTYNDDTDTVTNTLETTRIYAEKIWNPGVTPKTLHFELKYQGTDGKWKSFDPKAQVTLDETAADGSGNLEGLGRGNLQIDAKPYIENESWHAVWTNVPLVMSGSKLDGEGHTVYTVTELESGNYLVETEDGMTTYDGKQYFTLNIENNEKTSLTVQKNWYGVDSADKKDVIAGLYRAAVTDEELASGSLSEPQDAEPVAGDNGQQLTVTLNSGNNWKGTFSNLPKYDDEGSTYVYFAKELTIGGESVSDMDDDLYITYSNGRNDTNGTYITAINNIDRTELSGTKTWKDNGDAYGTRPDTIELTLYRSVNGGEKTEVTADIMKEEGITFTGWTKGTDEDADTWTYGYTGLPETDDSGNTYTYSVEEKAIGEVGEGDEYGVRYDDTNITNTLEDTIKIPVKKIWNDNDAEDRPESVTLVLYANGEKTDSSVTLNKNDHTDLFAGDEWEYTFENLPEYDANGVRIEYTVREENVPEGYEAYVDDSEMTVENVKDGGLIVRKTVSGNAGDKDKEFNFTVEFDNENINGTYGEMEFTGGIATFTLKDGESMSASGLPGETGYIVYEKEANSDGYSTSSVNATGKIPAGDTITAEFVNTKDIPPGGGTKTGDDMDIALPLTLMTAALAGMAALLLRKRAR